MCTTCIKKKKKKKKKKPKKTIKKTTTKKSQNFTSVKINPLYTSIQHLHFNCI